jgi:hypothetical protein
MLKLDGLHPIQGVGKNINYGWHSTENDLRRWISTFIAHLWFRGKNKWGLNTAYKVNLKVRLTVKKYFSVFI